MVKSVRTPDTRPREHKVETHSKTQHFRQQVQREMSITKREVGAEGRLLVVEVIVGAFDGFWSARRIHGYWHRVAVE